MSSENSVAALLNNVIQYQYNPCAIQTAVLQTLSDVTDGKITIVDPTNPFVFSLESSAVLTSAFLSQNETNTRKQYPAVAQTPEDLYLHMSDVDYIDRFAIPSKTKFSILLPKDETLNKMVADPTTGIRKIVIPRNTFFTIADTDFSIQYPIEICQLAHGGLQVIYDATVASPLQALSTNVIDFEIRKVLGGEYIYFEFEVQQFNIISNTSSLNSATDFKLDISLVDQYYYTRVYAENSDGTWSEIKTTHTDQVYDIYKPTAVIKVVDKLVTVSIPQIYTGTEMLKRGVRIDVYQTKGVFNLMLSEYPFNSFIATWLAIDNNDNNEYVAPLKTFRSVIPYSDATVSGGSNGMTFEELRTQVITNAIGAPSLPITNAQIETNLKINGYNIVKNIDNISNRTFLATKGMPAPKDEKLITAASASIETLSITINELVTIGSVINNNTSVTITPDTIFRDNNGIVSPVSDNELNTVLNLTVDQRAIAVTNGNYLYTPFHYVLDMTGDEFDSRPYYLDSPEIITKLFNSENDTTLIQVNTGAFSINKNANGYTIIITTKSGDVYKALPDDEVQVQMAFIPVGEKDRAYINGVLIGMTAEDERIYSFDFSTTFNIDSSNYLSLEKFFLYTEEERLTKTPLVNDFDIIYTTTSAMPSQWLSSDIDQVLGAFLLPLKAVGITHETLRVKFGYALDTLWSRSRSVVSSLPYKTWDVDVPMTHEADVYERDAVDSIVTFDANNNPIINILHAKGSQVLDRDGNVIYKHRIGDVVLDSNGNPTYIDTRNMIRQLDIMMIEGVYWFATDQIAVDYRNLLTQSVVTWLSNDLTNIDKKLLEKTNIFFYPNTNMGRINVMVNSGIIKAIDARQTFTVYLSVSKLVYDDSALREKLTSTTINVINDELKNTTVSLDGITSALRKQYGTDVVSVLVSGLGGSNNYPVITVMDNSQRCSIGKRLTITGDNNLIVEENIDISFIKYSQS